MRKISTRKGFIDEVKTRLPWHKVESEFNNYVNMNAVEIALKLKEIAGL
jgi:electron transfer flavoprotein alpha/beta subunit